MDALSPEHPCETVVLMKGTQVAGSEIGNNWVGHSIDISPGPMMIVQPTIEIGELYSKQRISKMIEACKRLKERMRAFGHSRDATDTILLKEFRGGVLRIAGANSAKSLRSMPVRRLFMDEVDAYPLDLDGEGDPVELAKKRTDTFANRKVFLCSTPTIKEFSRIEAEFDRTGKRRYFVPCPHCKGMDWIRWANIKWPKGKPYEAAL